MEHGAFACILNSGDGLGAADNTLDSPPTQMTREFFHSVLGEGIWGLDPTSSSSPTPIPAPLDFATGTLTYTRRNPSLSGAAFSYE